MKSETLRSATATASFHAPADCIARIRDRDTEKGDPQATARIAGILAAKRTDELLPLCHPLPIHAAEVLFAFEADRVVITAEAHTIGPTGVEMEALTAASMAALTLYDMLKPYAEPQDLPIGDTRLVEKTGGKSHYRRTLKQPASAAVFVVADTVAEGRKLDTAGRGVVDGLAGAGFEPVQYDIMPSEPTRLADALNAALARGTRLIVTVGGTGIGPRDHTVDTIAPLITTELPGVMETARAFGQRRTPYAAMARGIAGFCGDSLIVTFPGSRRGADETLTALLPSLVHILETRARHRSESS